MAFNHQSLVNARKLGQIGGIVPFDDLIYQPTGTFINAMAKLYTDHNNVFQTAAFKAALTQAVVEINAVIAAS